MLRYSLITPARNEAASIELTLRSVVAQTVRPVKWVLVNDGSTDRTHDIVSKYSAQHPWIELLDLPARAGRDFGGKVVAFNAGRARLTGNNYDIIGNLDADISFQPDYLQFLLARFAEERTLGVAGTPFVEDGVSYDYRFTNIEHVSGACQLFRKECFDDIGGYQPIEGGGIDWTAVTSARMMGWKTRTFTEKVCHHHRKMGTGAGGSSTVMFRQGQKDYRLGGHPMWQAFRSVFQMSRRPYLIGGFLLLCGYGWAGVKRSPRCVSPELIKFHRGEQMNRLRIALKRALPASFTANPSPRSGAAACSRAPANPAKR